MSTNVPFSVKLAKSLSSYLCFHLRVYKEFLAPGYSRKGITPWPENNTNKYQSIRLEAGPHGTEPFRLLSLGVTFVSLFWPSPSTLSEHQFLLVVSRLTIAVSKYCEMHGP